MKIIFSLFFFFQMNVSFGQLEQLRTVKRLYFVADSLNRLKQYFSVSDSTIQRMKEIDKEHPSRYAEEAGKLLKNEKYYDAAFVAYVGMMRYAYYNMVNPNYKASDDGALATSLQYIVGEPVNYYLKTNFDNMISTLEFSSSYFLENDYYFYRRSKDSAAYNKIGNSLRTTAEDFKSNREKFEKEWSEERNQMVKNIDMYIEQLEKMTPKERARLKKNN